MKRYADRFAVLLLAAFVVSGCSMNLEWQGAVRTPAPAAATAAAQPTATQPGATPQATATRASATATAAAPTAVVGLPAAPATPTPAPSVGAGLTTSPTLAGIETALQEIYDRVNPSVVLLEVVATSSSSFGFPFGGQQQTQGIGSGFVWDTQGHIVTNNHVVAGATSISVVFYDGATAAASIVGADPDSDLAVIKVNAPAEYFKPVTLADSTTVKVGQWAIAIGNPFGEQNTMTTGIISALGRSLPVSDETSVTTGGSYVIPDVIQTDAPINPGNSGGVLLDAQGRVIGVTSAIESSTQSSAGIGFAVPSVIVQRVVPSLIKTGRYDQTWLGITGGDLTAAIATAMNLPGGQRGALVSSVVQGGPAAIAGLRGSTRNATINGQQAPVGGDVIIAIEGKAIRTFGDVVAYLARYTEVEQTVSLTVLRDGKQQDIKVTLKARPSSQASAPRPGQAAAPGAYLGLTGVTVSADIARAMNLSASQRGVLVQQVIAGSPAAEAGLAAGTTPATINGAPVMVGGDIVIGFGNRAVSSVEDLTALLAQSDAGDIVTLTVIRNSRQARLRVVLGRQPTTLLPRG